MHEKIQGMLVYMKCVVEPRLDRKPLREKGARAQRLEQRERPKSRLGLPRFFEIFSEKKYKSIMAGV